MQQAQQHIHNATIAFICKHVVNHTKIHNTFLSTPSRTRSRIAGTAAIKVGLNTVASPLVPFFILLEVSVKVKGDPYPMALPTAAIKF